ncbi:MAG: M23 family metallopeptidase [Syntrophales bacterium]|nr:M23 family metallopeptidase [Syntrophales bacterium]
MKKPHFTFIIIPQGEKAARKFILPAYAVKLLSLLVVIGLATFFFLSQDFIKHRKTRDKLSKLAFVNNLQKRHIDLLAGKVETVERKMIELNNFDRKIRIMANLENCEKNDNLVGIGGSIPDESKTKSRLSEMEQALINEIHKNVDQLLDEASRQEESFQELLQYLENQKSILASTPSIWPAIGWVTSEFGYRVSPFTEKREFHKGIDIATKLGKEVVAPADGVIAKVSVKDRNLGNVIWIEHTKELSTCYAHLLKPSVKKGQQVKRGDVIGYVGNSGRSTGPHLHYSVMENGVYVNPRRYLF